MDEFDSRIVQLAIRYKNVDEFVSHFSKIFTSLSEKGKLFFDVGLTLMSNSFYVHAVHSWNEAAKCFAKIGEKEEEMACYNNIAVAYSRCGDYRKTIELYNKSLPYWKVSGDKLGQVSTYFNLGNAYSQLGYYKESLEYFEKSLSLAKEIGDLQRESECCNNIGTTYNFLGNASKAFDFLNASLQISKKLSNKKLEAKCYNNLGNTYSQLGDNEKAIEFFKKSLQMDKESGDREGESACYVNLGNAYHHFCDYRRAIESFESSLQIAKELGIKLLEAKCYTNLGNAYRDLGDFRKAIEFYNQSLRISKDIENRDEESSCYTCLGNAYRNIGEGNGDLKNFRKAIEFYEKALPIKGEIGDRRGEAICYTNYGSAYSRLGDFRKAIELYERSLQIAKEIGDRDEESTCYGNLGATYWSIGDAKKTIEFFEKSLSISREMGSVDKERITNFNLALLYREINDKSRAYDCCRRSIKLSEMVVERLVEENHKREYFGQTSDAYRLMVCLCIDAGKEKQAFHYVEKSKSRAFLELIAATYVKPTIRLTNEMSSLRAEEENRLAKLREIQTRHLRPNNILIEPDKVDRIVEELNAIYRKMEKIDPEYVSARKGAPLSLTDVHKMLSCQGKNAILIEYFVTPDETYIFTISIKDEELHVKSVPLTGAMLDRYIDNYWREIVNYPSYGDIGNSWLDLGTYLIEPIADLLTDKDLIYFVPYSSLHYLPLHALELEGKPLIINYPVVYSPSASLLKSCLGKGTQKLDSCVSIGVDFSEEAELIAKIFSSKATIGSKATKPKVKEKCEKIASDIIHFSCHGKYVGEAPLSSYVELYDGLLTAREIFDMRLNCELVTLSACQTGINERSQGDELVGLTRAFMYAGSPSVVASLWSVDSRSTQELMVDFYKRLKNGYDKATALQEAQKKTMKKYSHAYYWAPFVLVGKPTLKNPTEQ